jgi:hypothetical protein
MLKRSRCSCACPRGVIFRASRSRFTATRGRFLLNSTDAEQDSLLSPSVFTDAEGRASVFLFSNDAGPSLVTATHSASGSVAQREVQMVARKAASMTCRRTRHWWAPTLWVASTSRAKSSLRCEIRTAMRLLGPSSISASPTSRVDPSLQLPPLLTSSVERPRITSPEPAPALRMASALTRSFCPRPR